MSKFTFEGQALYKDEKATQRSNHDDPLDEKGVNGSDSEKYAVEHDTQVNTDVGDVYEDIRAIDLDENGKEKPIGVCCCSPKLLIVTRHRERI